MNDMQLENFVASYMSDNAPGVRAKATIEQSESAKEQQGKKSE